MNRAVAIARLTRIEHSIMLVIAVVAAEIISGGLPSAYVLALSIITPIFVSMGSFAINDYFDVHTDRENKRTERPLVSGVLSERSAFAIAIFCFAIGTLASVFINVLAFAIALAFSVLAFLYSYKMKNMLLIGNVYIAFSMVIPFLYGNSITGATLNLNILLISFTVFLSGLAREIHGMIRDYKGDLKVRKARNLIFHIGGERSAWFAFTLYIEAIAISIFMFFFKSPFAYNLVYLVPIVVVDIALFFMALGYARKNYTDGFFRLSRNLSLGAMAVAIIVYLAAALVYIAI
ncbi:MAG: UbiA family prenyltransferase [Candidatus Micrarchaeota archaeon]|nr:UbiA family prenyltransferase [Candidatus Micrarchaeota archaeon]